MRKKRRRKIGDGLIWLVMLVLLCLPSTGLAAGVLIPTIKAAPGEEVEIPVKVEGVENLAGMKLVLSYDSKVLIFQKEKKAAVAQSLMHIVNPNTPGKLIVVMAGAKGVEIKNGPIIYLTFRIREKVSGERTSIQIEEVQLMTDQLKNLTPDIRNGEVLVTKYATGR